MSPITRFGMRTFWAIICHSAVFSWPRSRSLRPSKRRPPAHSSTASITDVPGLAQPMSMWCAVVTENATSSPSLNTGTIRPRSGEWDAPR
jgi:hypothetical protein